MKFISVVLISLSFTLSLFTISLAQNKLLGEIHFPNSGAEAAQSDFIEGVKFLHNFEYADGARAFRKARETDPGFAMAYWGEAMTHNHPIWFQQERDAAMEILSRLGETVQERQERAETQREKDYMMTLEVLYGNTPESAGKSKEERDVLYMEAMKDLHEKYPDDDEAATFYGLSILGTAHEGRDYSTYMKAAAVLYNVWDQNKQHPGAAHYLIHSFDDPVHAPLGLPMAEAYSEIAPAAAHAQHMTSHIFLALGMWDDVIDANIVARDVQTARQSELNEPETVCGHYPWWLQYGYLQEGKTSEALQVLSTCRERVQGEPTESEIWHFAIMRGHYLVDSENWQDAANWTTVIEPGSGAGMNYFYTSALAAVHSGDTGSASENLGYLMQSPESNGRDIRADQIKSLLLIEEGKTAEGLSLLRQAAATEAELPIDFGPPAIVKPSFELLGDVLTDLGYHEEAVEAYNKQLERTPKRLRSLKGKEQAAALVSGMNQ